MDRNSAYKYLISNFGERCSICGAEGVPLELHHIIPLKDGGDDSFINLRLVCSQCHSKTHYRLREYDFVIYLVQLLKLNDNFRNVRTEVRFDTARRYIADIVAEEKIEDKWYNITFECKVSSSFINSRLLKILTRLNSYQQLIGNSRLIFAFPGELDDKHYKRFKIANIEIWDLAYISNRFNKEILKTAHPILQSLFLAKKPTILPLERQLIQDLKQCNPGKRDWYKYQKLIGQILEILFCPPLLTPISEISDISGVNRRDFILPNYSEDGFWVFLRSKYSADYIVADAKNYKGKISKKCVLQISNYLKKHGAGMFGIIISRKEGDKGCIQTIREKWAIDGKLIIILTDDDVEKMLLEKSSGRPPEIIIRQKIEDFRITM